MARCATAGSLGCSVLAHVRFGTNEGNRSKEGTVLQPVRESQDKLEPKWCLAHLLDPVILFQIMMVQRCPSSPLHRSFNLGFMKPFSVSVSQDL